MTLSWISRRNGDSFEPPWVDLYSLARLPPSGASARSARRSSKSSSPCTALHASWARRGPPGRYHERARVSGGSILIRSPRRHAAKLRTTGASRKIATRVATPATARDGCSRAARRPDRWSRGRGPFSLATAGLLAADTWPTKAVLTRWMSAPVGAAYCATRWT